MRIRGAGPDDRDVIWAMLRGVFRAGDTYAIDPDISRDEALAYWIGAHTYVAEDSNAPVGTYYVRRNQPGGGAHVCNCGFITAPNANGKGVARAMLAHALGEAKRIGFTAMQFNFVLASNIRAIDIWQRAGFIEIGRQPRAFLHPTLGPVDALILHRFLD